jgi:hypothetical membrane protein
MDVRRVATWGGVLGPVGFVSSWAVAGRRTAGYRPLDDAISRLAVKGAPARVLMTAGFSGLGTTLSVFACLRRHELGAAGAAATLVSGLATLGAGFTRLERSPAADAAHLVFAVAGYASLSVAPALARRSLRDHGHGGVAALAPFVAIVSSCSLTATACGPRRGLFQRVGLTVGDAWLLATAVSLLRRGAERPQAAPATA